jgi:hypothetical protein
MSFLFDFFDQFREMAMADPWHFILLVLVSGAAGWLWGKRSASEKVAIANQHVSFLKDRLVAKAPVQDRDVEIKRIEAELKKQDRLADKQRRSP